MAETRIEDQETALPAKRKPDLTSSDAPEDPPAKAPKTADKINGAAHAGALQAGGNGEAKAAAADASGGSGDGKGEVKGAVIGAEEDEEDDEDYNGGGEGVQKDAEPVVNDVKGKGIMKMDKGKRKLMPGESWDDDSEGGDDSDDDDSSSDSDSDSDDDDNSGSDSDLAEDPLAEVDLDNILPSRTRYTRGQSGIVITEKFTPWSGGGGDSKA